jgi:hypothetical protein
MPVNALKTKPDAAPAEPLYERLNISQLAERFNLNRETVRHRTNLAGITPFSKESKKVIYELTPRLQSVLSQTNQLLSDAKTRREMAVADREELKVSQLRGELAPIKEVVELTQAVFTALYREFAQRQPNRLAHRLAKAKTAALAAKTLKLDTDEIFRRLREADETLVPKI